VGPEVQAWVQCSLHGTKDFTDGRICGFEADALLSPVVIDGIQRLGVKLKLNSCLITQKIEPVPKQGVRESYLGDSLVQGSLNGKCGWRSRCGDALADGPDREECDAEQQ